MIFACGESLFDVFSAGETPQGVALDGRMGGSPLNVAIGLSRLGQSVAFLGSIGRDFAGHRMVRALVEEGVRTDWVARVEEPTTLMLVGLDERGVPSYSFYGERGADRQLRPEHLHSVPAGAAAYHFGSYSMVVHPTAATLRGLIEREGARSVISYDPNVRLRVEPDVRCWLDVLDWMLPRAHLLKISEEDLGLLYPGRSVDDFAAAAIAAGARLVVVTRGNNGAMGLSTTASLAVPAAPTTLVDTVGAGDTFQAALLTWLAETGRLSVSGIGSLDAASLGAALGFAARAAAITCSRRGADMPRRAELADIDETGT